MLKPLGLSAELRLPFDAAVAKVREALKREGFGVLSEIDLRAAFKDKLGQDFRPYLILGACNPPLAYKAVTADPSVGLLLPCNVTIEWLSDERTGVRLTNPEALLGVATLAATQVAAVARDAGERMLRVQADLLKSNV